MSYTPVVYPGSIYGIGVGSVAAHILNTTTDPVPIQPPASGFLNVAGSVNVDNAVLVGSLATQGVIGSVAVTNAVTVGSLATQGVIGSVQITSSLLSVSGPTQLFGMGSGTTAWVPVMTLSGAAGAPQPLVSTSSVTVDSVFVASGNVFVQSGNAWAGIGSTRTVLYDNAGAELDYRQENENWNAADHGVLIFGRDTESSPNKYRALTTDTAGHLQIDYGPGSGAVFVTNPVVVGSLATQGVIGSVAVTNYTGSVYVVNGAGSFAVQGISGNSLGFYGMGSGTTAWNPIMIESGAAGAPQRVVTAGTVSVSSVFVASGNVFVQSGNAWAGVGSVTGAVTQTGSVAITSSAVLTTVGVAGSEMGRVSFSIPTTSKYTEAAINCATSGLNIIVSGTNAQTIRIYGMFFTVNGAGQVRIVESGPGTNSELVPLMSLSSLSFPPMGDPWFTTGGSNSVYLGLSAATQTSGRVYYTKS